MKKFSRFTINTAIIIAVTTLIFADLYLWYSTQSFLIGEIKNDMNNQVNLSRKFINNQDIINSNYENLKTIANEINELTGFRTTLISKNGEVLADSEIEIDELQEVENHIGREEVQESLASGKGFGIRKSATINKDLMYYCENLYLENRVIGFIRFAMFSDNFDMKMSSLRNIIIIVNIFILAVVLIFIYLWKQQFHKQIDFLKYQLDFANDTKTPTQIGQQPYFEFDSLAGKINAYVRAVSDLFHKISNRNTELLTILNSFKDGVASFNTDGKLIYSNKAFRKIGNFDIGNKEETHYYDFIDYPPLLNDIKKFLEDRKKISKKVKYYGNAHIEYTIRTLKTVDSELPGFTIYLKNLTKLRNLEVIREDFVSNVSHEFKTPLTSIKGYTETLQSIDKPNEETLKNFLGKIEKQANKLENIVTDLLQLSRIEKNELFELKPMYPTEVITDFAADFKIMCESKGIEFNLSLSETIETAKIYGDPQVIQTIISNLLTNSVKYGRKNGKISVHLKSDEDFYIINVEDNGLGIPEVDKSRIFERFYRVEKTRTAYPEGTGLGLSIVKNAVELLAGSIDLESIYGEGSKFTVSIPLLK